MGNTSCSKAHARISPASGFEQKGRISFEKFRGNLSSLQPVRWVEFGKTPTVLGSSSAVATQLVTTKTGLKIPSGQLAGGAFTVEAGQTKSSHPT